MGVGGQLHVCDASRRGELLFGVRAPAGRRLPVVGSIRAMPCPPKDVPSSQSAIIEPPPASGAARSGPDGFRWTARCFALEARPRPPRTSIFPWVDQHGDHPVGAWRASPRRSPRPPRVRKAFAEVGEKASFEGSDRERCRSRQNSGPAKPFSDSQERVLSCGDSSRA
jgi:hypothetical protein